MSPEEATKIAAIAARVDGGCSVCVASTTAALVEAFPEFVWWSLVWEARGEDCRVTVTELRAAEREARGRE